MEVGDILFDNYRLVRRIGQGSSGEVWQAVNTLTDINCAIKVYVALDRDGVEEFKEEFKNSYSLNHTNILHATHFNVKDRRPYLFMPYCPVSAENLIGRLTIEREIWHFIHDVAAGLSFLHSRNIIHHDIKPANILQDEQGNYLITDFGVSTKMRDTIRRNSRLNGLSEMIGGSPAYMGPELFGETQMQVFATDMWALGVTIYEVITGNLPFQGMGGVMLRGGASYPNIGNDFSADLRNTVVACLQKETWDRPLAGDLAEYAKAKMEGKNVQIPWNISKGSTSPVNSYLKLSVSQISCTYNEGYKNIKISSSTAWSVQQKNESWIHIEKLSEGEIKVSVDTNNGDSVRVGQIVFVNDDGKTSKITIKQGMKSHWQRMSQKGRNTVKVLIGIGCLAIIGIVFLVININERKRLIDGYSREYTKKMNIVNQCVENKDASCVVSALNRMKSIEESGYFPDDKKKEWNNKRMQLIHNAKIDLENLQAEYDGLPSFYKTGTAGTKLKAGIDYNLSIINNLRTEEEKQVDVLMTNYNAKIKEYHALKSKIVIKSDDASHKSNMQNLRQIQRLLTEIHKIESDSSFPQGSKQYDVEMKEYNDILDSLIIMYKGDIQQYSSIPEVVRVYNEYINDLEKYKL